MRKIYFAGRKIGTAYFGNMLVYRSDMKVSVPSVTDTVKTYNGAAQSPTISGYDSSIIR